MPIHGLTDRYRPGDGLPSLGKLRKGGEKQNNRPGANLDHFRVTFEDGYKDLEVVFKQLYPDPIRKIEGVRLVGVTPEAVFDPFMMEFGGGKLKVKCTGGGETGQIVRHLQENMRYSDAPKPCAWPNCGCKPTGYLRCILVDLYKETGVFGTFTLETHGAMDIRLIDAFLRDAYLLYGDLSRVHFNIGRRMKQITYTAPDRNTGELQRRARQEALVYLEFNPLWVKEVGLLAVQAHPSLPAPAAEDNPTMAQLPAGDAAPLADEPEVMESHAEAPDIEEADFAEIPEDDDAQAAVTPSGAQAPASLGFASPPTGYDPHLKGFDWEALYAKHKEKFSSKTHFKNWVLKLDKEGVLDGEAGEALIEAMVAEKPTLKGQPGIFGPAEAWKQFRILVQQLLFMDEQAILTALATVTGDKILGPGDFKGTMLDAKAICLIARADYKADKLRKVAPPNLTDETIKHAEAMLKAMAEGATADARKTA